MNQGTHMSAKSCEKDIIMLALPELENYKWRRFSYNEATKGSGDF